MRPLARADCSTASTNTAAVACLATAFKATLSAAQESTVEVAFSQANTVRLWLRDMTSRLER